MKKLLLSALLVAGAASFANAEEVVVFTDNFEWLEPWCQAEKEGKKAGNTIGTDDSNAYCPQLGTMKVDGVTTFKEFQNRGYDFVTIKDPSKDKERTPQQNVYLQQGYLKFGLTAYQSGIVLPSMEVPADVTATLSFSTCTQKGTKEPFAYDKTELVAIVENDGEAKAFPIEMTYLPDGAAYAWYTVSVALDGATINSNTKITVRNADSQWPSPKAFRWYLKDIKVAYTTTGIAGVEADANAPVEYFNLLGVRVANPENGVYIRRQGNKATKVVIR